MSLEFDEDEEAELESPADDSPAAGAGGDASPAPGGDAEQHQRVACYNAEEINSEVFEELDLHPNLVREVQTAWHTFLGGAASREAAGEDIFNAVFEAAPSMQSMFKLPRAVMAVRFLGGLNQIMLSLESPAQLKVVVETLGFSHLDLEVTPARAGVFRDAIVDLLLVELGPQLTEHGIMGFRTVLNYVGGAFIYVRTNYAIRLRILESSWDEANRETKRRSRGDGEDQEEDEHSGSFSGMLSGDKATAKNTMVVPTTYPDMFRFNAAVMGLQSRIWMEDVLKLFDSMVRNASNPRRLQEECDVLSLLLAKRKGEIKLSEYKAVMLSSLRAVVPKSWDSEHEVAWTWLWEYIERHVQAHLGVPGQHQRALDKFLDALEESDLDTLRREVYAQFFQLAPIGMDFFRASTTRLHFIADKVVAMVQEMYKEPSDTVDSVSQIGLKHVGYGVPTELFAPYVSAAIQVVKTLTEDTVAVDAFAWSMNLLSRILARVVDEGSTVVMKAINTNTRQAIRKALACAPRGARSDWVMKVQVGSETISPLLWAIETGSLAAAEAILQDVVTIRADRDRYYVGIDTLFKVHPDIVSRLCHDAPSLITILLDGCIWRSRVAENGRRRVIYFVRHLLADQEGRFSQALEWLNEHQDAVRLMTHPVPALVMDLVWRGVAQRMFLRSKLWLLANLCIFSAGQCILNRYQEDSLTEQSSLAIRVAIFICRCFTYGLGMTSLIGTHVRRALLDVQAGATRPIGQFRVPESFVQPQGVASLMLTLSLMVMFVVEPVLTCMSKKAVRGRLFTSQCEDAEGLFGIYSSFSMLAVMCYYILVADLCIISTRMSAFVLVIGRTLSNLALNLVVLGSLIVTFAAGVSVLNQDHDEFSSLPEAFSTLLKMCLGLVDEKTYSSLSDFPVLYLCVIVFSILAGVFILNLLVSQLTASFDSSFQDALGLARLRRAEVVVRNMAAARQANWTSFFKSLELDRPCEFGEGDTGFPGGYMLFESAADHITTTDSIRRYGGTTSAEAPWPADDTRGQDKAFDMESRCEQLESLLKKSLKKIEASRRKAGAGGGGSSSRGSDSRSRSSGQSSGSSA